MSWWQPTRWSTPSTASTSFTVRQSACLLTRFPTPDIPRSASSLMSPRTHRSRTGGTRGPMEQRAFKAWVTDVYDDIWESTYRSQLREAFIEDAHRGIPMETDPMGDLKWIRHDLIHNRSVASQCAKCKVLTWFERGEQMRMGGRHVLDFSTRWDSSPAGPAQSGIASSCGFRSPNHSRRRRTFRVSSRCAPCTNHRIPNIDTVPASFSRTDTSRRFFFEPRGSLEAIGIAGGTSESTTTATFTSRPATSPGTRTLAHAVRPTDSRCRSPFPGVPYRVALPALSSLSAGLHRPLPDVESSSPA